MTSGVSVRSILGTIHLWSGLILFIPFVLLGLTGSVLVFHHEIIDWQAGDLVYASEGQPRAITEIIDAAKERVSADFVPAFLSMPEHSGASASVRFAPEGASFRDPRAVQVFVDPVTLDVRGTSTGRNTLVRFIHDLHANLMLDRDTGRTIVGTLGLVMFLLGITGLVLWWPRNGGWKAAFIVKWNANTLRFSRDLHGAFGIWMLVVFLAVTVSGIYLCFPQATGAVVRAVFPGDDPRGINRVRVKAVAGAVAMPHGEAIALARDAVPDARILSIFFPSEASRPLRVRMGRDDHLHGAPSITVMIDPWRRKVAAVSDPKDYTTGQWIQAWQRGLHGGEGLGWTWKILVFVSGLLPLLFSVTGIIMWWIKRRTRRLSSGDAATLRSAGE